VIIVGAGAAGSAAAWRLSVGGMRVLCLERGNWQEENSFPGTKDDWEILRQTEWSPNPNQRRQLFDLEIDSENSDIKPLACAAVGGSTIMWSCHFPRFHPSDFCTQTLDQVGDDWPIRYEQLLPYYRLNERMMGVSGLTGNPAYPDDSPLRLRPIPLSEGGRRIAVAFNALGWSWWPADLAINSEPYGNKRGACTNCGPCELNCPQKAKATTDVVYWPLAITAGAKLLTGARVTRVETDSSGAASGVVYLDEAGRSHRIRAKRVMLAGNGIGTARLLHLSYQKSHQNGLANSSGLVGKRLMLHPLARVTGLFHEAISGHKGITAGSFVSHYFYETDPKRGFRRGFKLQAIGTQGPAMVASGSMGKPITWGVNHHSEFLRHFDRGYSISVCSDDMPQESNQVTLSSKLKADDGLPAAGISYRTPQEAKKALAMGVDKAKQALAQAGCYETIENHSLPEAGFHLMGTTRMGNDRESSVVNQWGETHDVRGLFVIDGSVFVTAAAVNPTNTIQAIALRAADHILSTSGRALPHV